MCDVPCLVRAWHLCVYHAVSLLPLAVCASYMQCLLSTTLVSTRANVIHRVLVSDEPVVFQAVIDELKQKRLMVQQKDALIQELNQQVHASNVAGDTSGT